MSTTALLSKWRHQRKAATYQFSTKMLTKFSIQIQCSKQGRQFSNAFHEAFKPVTENISRFIQRKPEMEF